MANSGWQKQMIARRVTRLRAEALQRAGTETGRSGDQEIRKSGYQGDRGLGAIIECGEGSGDLHIEK
jgi:hypothetical protein